MHSVQSSSKIAWYVKQNNLMDYFGTFTPVFTLRHYAPHETITSPFKQSDAVQFLVEGNLLIYEMPNENSFFALASPYYAARMIGEIELIDPNFRSSFVEAKTDVYTLALSYAEYGDLLRNDPKFLTAVALSLSKKLSTAVQTANNLTVHDQLLKYIDILSPGDKLQDVTTLAQAFQASPRQIIRALNDAVEEGYLSHPKKGTYEVLKKTNCV